MEQLAILMATYNGEKYIAEQLDSLLNQTVSDFTVYIHDDGSTDNTVEIIKQYQKKYPDRFQCLEYPPSGGAKNNFLSLLRMVEAQYYMFCDQDDVWFPEKVKISYSEMKKCESGNWDMPCVVFGDMQVTDRERRVISTSYLKYVKKDPQKISLKELLVQNVAAGCTMMINRKLALLSLHYQNQDSIFMHDWWIMLIAACVGKIAYMNKPLLMYRQHGDNSVGIGKDRYKWLKEKVRNVIGGKQLDVSKQGIIYQRKIARELLKLEVLTEADQKLLNRLATIEKENKYIRMQFYIRNRMICLDWKNFWKIFLV